MYSKDMFIKILKDVWMTVPKIIEMSNYYSKTGNVFTLVSKVHILCIYM